MARGLGLDLHEFPMSKILLGLGALIVLVGSSTVAPPVDKVVFLDVGQGDAILLQHETSQILIDGGQGMMVLERLAKEMPWFDRTIDVVISTHPDRDHLEGLLHVLERYNVSLVLLPRVVHTSQLQETWLRKIEEAKIREGTEFRFANIGQRLTVGELNVDILGPRAEAVASAKAGKTNNASVITRVSMHNMSWLLTGDAEAPIERNLIKTIPAEQLNVTVLKAGHHGSKTSTTAELLTATSPQTVIISVGADNTFGHPHESVLARLKNFRVLRTDQVGSIRFVFENGNWLVGCHSRNSTVLFPKPCL